MESLFGDGAHLNAVQAYVAGDAAMLNALAEANPDHWLVHRECARYAVDTKQLDEAHHHVGAALKCGGTVAESDWDLWHIVSAIKSLRGDIREAEAALDIAIRLSTRSGSPKGYPLLWGAYAALAFQRGDHQEAHVRLFRCVDAPPKEPEDERAQGEAFFLMGRPKDAWPKWEARLTAKRIRVHTPDLPPYPLLKSPWGNKVPAKQGAKVVVWGEQGQGDQIQFARYLERFKALSKATLYLKTIPTLDSWFQPLIEQGIVEGFADPALEADYQVALMSLGYYLMDGPIPAPFSPVAPASVKGRVGYCWRGNPRHGNDHDRSCPTREEFVAGLQLPEDAINLTFGDEDYAGGEDWVETAKVVAGCERIYTVDTAIAHVAGSVGVPTTTVVAAIPDWRWGSTGDSTPWYRKMRLVRKRWVYGWPEALEEARG